MCVFSVDQKFNTGQKFSIILYGKLKLLFLETKKLNLAQINVQISLNGQ